MKKDEKEGFPLENLKQKYHLKQKKPDKKSFFCQVRKTFFFLTKIDVYIAFLRFKKKKGRKDMDTRKVKGYQKNRRNRLGIPSFFFREKKQTTGSLFLNTEISLPGQQIYFFCLLFCQVRKSCLQKGTPLF